MTSDHRNVEAMLGQMNLRQPSSQLDERVNQICQSACMESPRRRMPGSGNTRIRLITVGLVASLAGFLLGQFVDLKPDNPESGGNIANSVDHSSNLTSVRFNPNAFALLHGHSTKSEFSNCKDCHSASGELPEKYMGWFYGDSELFDQHPQSDVSECSDCHTFGSPPTPEVPKQFKDSNCSACHDAGSSLPELEVAMKPNLEEG